MTEGIKGCDRYRKEERGDGSHKKNVIGTGRKKGMIQGVKGCDRYGKEERGDGRYKRM
jgi:hypothetical protein